MAKIRKSDLEPMSDEDIRIFYATVGLSLLPPKVREYILELEGKSESKLSGGLNRVYGLLREIIIERFLNQR